MKKATELNALICLLDDPDTEIFDHVSGKIASFGRSVIPALESAWQESMDPLLQQRVERIIRQIQLELISDDFKSWLSHESDNLLKGMFLVSKCQNDNADENEFCSKIEAIKRAIWLELNYNLTTLEQVNIFNHVFYSLQGYSTDEEYSTSADFNLQALLQNKKGNGFSMGMLYLLLAQELGMPIYGVNLPDHLVLAYTKKQIQPDDKLDHRKDILFYINPLNEGAIFTRSEIQAYFDKFKLDMDPSFFVPSANKVIVKSFLEKLLLVYETEKDLDQVNYLKDILKLF